MNRGLICLLLLLIPAGCTEEASPSLPAPDTGTIADAGHACGQDNEMVLVITTLTFGRENPPGVSQGLDLDGIDSDTSDPAGCFKADMTDPDGNTGVDNQFARIVPGLIAVGGEAIEGLVQQAINSGQLLLIVRLTHVDDLTNDDCVTFELLRGTGVPNVGTQGLIESGQTFDRDPARESTRIENATIKDGWLSAGPLDFDLPLQIFDVQLTIPARTATFRIKLDEGEQTRGYMSGKVSASEIRAIADRIEGGGDVADLVVTVVESNADLTPNEDGVCQDLSVTLEFDQTPGFLFEDDPSAAP